MEILDSNGSMRQFVYISTAAELQESDLADILVASQENNRRAGLTGFLLYNGRNFLQLLEGPQAELVALMNRLARDWRHSGIVRLEDRPITARAFPEWAMQRIQLSATLDGREDHFKSVLPANLDSQVQRTVLNFARLN